MAPNSSDFKSHQELSLLCFIASLIPYCLSTEHATQRMNGLPVVVLKTLDFISLQRRFIVSGAALEIGP